MLGVLDRGSAVASPSDAAPADAELVAAARVDRRAFAPLYARYADPVYRYCHRRLGSKEAAEDATSLVFTKALAALLGCRDRSFRSWLFAIAHNVIVDRVRSERATCPLDDATEVEDPTPPPAEQAIAADEGRRLRALLGHLPPDQRRVVELRLSGLTGPETARVLGRSHGAVKVAQFRAYARLRALLSEESGLGGSGDG